MNERSNGNSGRRPCVDGFRPLRCAAIIPALNEALTVSAVVRDVRAAGIGEVIVVDNGSTDETRRRAEAAGARVVAEPRRGYGAACLAGLAALPEDRDAVIFLDADGSDDPREICRLLGPIERDEADLVIGSRTRGECAKGALTLAQRLGNRLAGWLLGVWYGAPCTDLGPMRAIRVDALRRLGMRDLGLGWTAEMQARAAARKLRVAEIPVRYRRRLAGRSKISGTLAGSLKAGAKILWTLLALRFLQPPR